MIFGTIAAYKVATPTTSHWAGSTHLEFGHTVYIGLSAFILNLAIAVILTLIFKAARVAGGTDETLPHQYTADPAEASAPASASVEFGISDAGGALSKAFPAGRTASVIQVSGDRHLGPVHLFDLRALIIRDDADTCWLTRQMQRSRITTPGPAVINDPAPR